MDYLPPTLCGDQYSDALTLGPRFQADHASVAVGASSTDTAAVLFQVAQGKPGDYRWTDEREFTAQPQTFRVGNLVGIRFRNAKAGTPATVACYLLGKSDPDIQPGTPFSIPKLTIEHNDSNVDSVPTLDFEDAVNIIWSVIDDPTNLRVKLSALITGLVAAQVANAADLSAAGNTFIGAIVAAGLLVDSATRGGLGYSAGAGGSVTCAPNGSCTSNTMCGAVTSTAACATGTTHYFIVNSSRVGATDTIIVNVMNGGDGLAQTATVTEVASGGFCITYTNSSGVGLTPIFNWAVIKAVEA